MERSLVLVKPDAMERELAGAIIARLQAEGLKLTALRMLQMDRALASKHYAVHKDKPFFNDLVAYITSTPSSCLFQGEKPLPDPQGYGATNPATPNRNHRKQYG
jgi:nucleoside-diphosphate kinase